MLQNKGRTMLTGSVVLFLCLLLGNPARAAEGVRQGLILWYQAVLPIQLPFAAGICMLMQLTEGGWMPVRMQAWLIGQLAGYPMGALAVGQLYQSGRLKMEGLTRTAAACNMAGPLFVVGTVGSCLLGDVRWGYVLLAVHWICAGAIACLGAARRKTATDGIHPQRSRKSGEPLGTVMGSAVSEAAQLMLKVGGFIALFSVILQWVPQEMGIVLEMTNGIDWICAQPWPLKWKLTGCSFAINFSGLCIILQSLAAGKEAPMRSGSFFAWKLLQGVAAAVLMWGICQFLGM